MDIEKFSCTKEFESYAMQNLPECVSCYYKSGEGDENTVKWNKDAFKKIRFLPRVLKDVSKRDLSTTVLGEKVSMPLGISPTAFQEMAHSDGESGIVKAAESAKTVYILSSYASSSADEVAKAAPNAIRWMQMNVFHDRNYVKHLIRQAEKAGFKALVVSVDNAVYGRSKTSNFEMCMKNHIRKVGVLEDYLSTNKELLNKYLENKSQYVHDILDPSATWAYVDWLKRITKLPIVLKGIVTVEDALLGVKHGASAIFISNHGGRQLEDVTATIEVLPNIVKAVGDEVEVYLDGGVTSGTDVFKAVALGAKMVFVGRVMLWGLACGGEKGAKAVLEIMRQEFDQVVALTGCTNIREITKELVAHESSFKF